MSVQALTAVMEHSEAQGSARVVMFVLADHSDEYGFSWPGVERVAHRTRVTPRSVQFHLADLKKVGELLVYERKGRTNVYQIVLPGLTAVDNEELAKLRAWGIEPLKESSPEEGLTKDSPLTARSLVTYGSGEETRRDLSPLKKPSPPPLGVCGNCETLLDPDGFCQGCGLLWEDGVSNVVESL